MQHASMATGNVSMPRIKDVLLEHVSRDIKAVRNSIVSHGFVKTSPYLYRTSCRQLHRQQSDVATVMDALTNQDKYAQNLCNHLDHVFMHG